MGLGGNDGGAHWEVEAQLSGPGDDLDGANRRRGHRRPKVEEELEVDAAGLPAGRGSVRGSRTTSRSSWAQPRGEGVAVAVVVLVGGDGCVRVRAREKEQRSGASRKSERGPRGWRGVSGRRGGRQGGCHGEAGGGRRSSGARHASPLPTGRGRRGQGGRWAGPAGGAGPAGPGKWRQVIPFSLCLFLIISVFYFAGLF